jgi:hypothetical protein
MSLSRQDGSALDANGVGSVVRGAKALSRLTVW